MPAKLTTGYLTRPEAAKLYNRSRRALERDLDVAIQIGDDETLAHWKLMTKDGRVREAVDVTIDIVKQFVADGMSPVWCVEAVFLESEYGHKGTIKPPKTPSVEASGAEANEPSTDAPSSQAPLPNDVPFLRERIQILEREKQQERERHDRIVGKLFEQLDVKDKQISAWDEVTQGLTKGLATGKLTPALPVATETPASTIVDQRHETPKRTVPTSTAPGTSQPKVTQAPPRAKPNAKPPKSPKRTPSRPSKPASHKTDATDKPTRPKTPAPRKSPAKRKTQPKKPPTALDKFMKLFT